MCNEKEIRGIYYAEFNLITTIESLTNERSVHSNTFFLLFSHFFFFSIEIYTYPNMCHMCLNIYLLGFPAYNTVKTYITTDILIFGVR